MNTSCKKLVGRFFKSFRFIPVPARLLSRVFSACRPNNCDNLVRPWLNIFSLVDNILKSRVPVNRHTCAVDYLQTRFTNQLNKHLTPKLINISVPLLSIFCFGAAQIEGDVTWPSNLISTDASVKISIANAQLKRPELRLFHDNSPVKSHKFVQTNSEHSVTMNFGCENFIQPGKYSKTAFFGFLH